MAGDPEPSSLPDRAVTEVAGAGLPWSWRALLAPWVVFGSLLQVSMYLVDQTRRGLDADMVHMWAMRTPPELLSRLAQGGAIGVAVLVPSFWLSRLFKLQKPGFVLLTSLPIPLALLLWGVWPSERNAVWVTYLPTWLAPLALAISLAATAASYLWVATALKTKA